MVACVALLLPATTAKAQHHHDGGGHGHGFGIHIDSGHHDVGHYDHHSDWHYVVPHYDSHYYGTYYSDAGINYYTPRTYVTDPGTYVAAKPVEIEFGGYAHVDDLSGRLELLANDLCLDLHYNYEHNPGFAATYREAYKILDTAKYVHAKEHQGDKAEVAQRVDELDGLLHHVQGEVKGWSRRQSKQIAQGGVQTKLDSVEATLHHLMNDVGVKGAHGEPQKSEGETTVETAPPPEPVTIPPPAKP